MYEFAAHCDAEGRMSRFVSERGSRLACCRGCGHLLASPDPAAHAHRFAELRDLHLDRPA